MEKESKVDVIVRVLKANEMLIDEFGYDNFNSIKEELQSIAVSIVAELTKKDLEEGHKFKYIVITGRTNKKGKTVKFDFLTRRIGFVNLTNRKNSKGKEIFLSVSSKSSNEILVPCNDSLEISYSTETIIVKSSGGYVDYRIAAFE